MGSPFSSLASFIPSEPDDPNAQPAAPTPQPAPAPSPAAQAQPAPQPQPEDSAPPAAPDAQQPQQQDSAQPLAEDTNDYGPVAAYQSDLPRSAQAVARRMTEAGYDTHHIAGVLGCLQQESGLDNMNVGDNETSFGVAQWHNSRITGLGQFARDRNIDPYDADTQAQYMVHELNGGDPSLVRAGKDLAAQNNVAGAARVWRAEFERPAGNYDDAAIAAGSRFLPSVQKYVQGLQSGQVGQKQAADGTGNGTADGTGGESGQGTTLDPVSRMMKLVGGDQETAAPFIKAGGGTLDPRKDNYCAAFTNSALAQAGIRGSNSNVATSFLGWGSEVPDTDHLQRNDVVVVPRGNPMGQIGGHVGLATGELSPDGTQIQVVSGNTQHGHIAVEWYPISDVAVRRSDTANTQSQGAQGAAPDVSPTRMPTTNATVQVNGLTLPDFSKGAPVPHGTGTPMDPSDAARYHASNAPEGFGEMARQFAGTLSDSAWGMGRDILGGNGPTGNFVQSTEDWLGKKLGTDLSWLHKVPLAALPGGALMLQPGVQESFKPMLATADQLHDAANRSIGYDPSAPTSGWGELGRNAALVGMMLGPGAVGEVGAAARAGQIGAAAKVAGQAVERAAVGGVTLTEAPEAVKDLTGSETAGEISSIGLAAVLGMRVPVLEKFLPTISNITTGAVNAGKKFVGEGLPAEAVLGNLTPSQLHDSFATGLRGAMGENLQKAELELTQLARPTSFASAGDVNANLTQGSDLLGGAIRDSVDAARTQERALWQQVDKDIPRDYTGANNAYNQELNNFAETQRLYNRPDTDFPSTILNNVFKTSNPTKQVSTGILDAEGRPIMTTVSGTGKQGLGTVNNLGSGQEARSQIEENIRYLQNNPDTPGARSQIGVLQRVSHSLLDDMSDLSNGAGDTADKVAAFNRARAFSRALAETRSQPDIAAILSKGIANGRDGIDTALSASRFLGNGGDGVAGLRQIQSIAKLNTGDPQNVQGLFADTVRQNFIKAAAPDGEHLNIGAGNRFLQRYGQILDQMPDVKGQIQSAIAGEQNVTQALGGPPKGWSPDPTGAQARTAAVNNWMDAPVDAVVKAFDGRSPLEQRNMLQNVVAQTSRDGTGAAFAGFRQAIVDKALEGADAQGSAVALSKWAEKNQGLIKGMSDGPDPTFGDRVTALTNVGSTAGRMAAVTDLAQRLLGTHLGSIINHATGGGEGAGGSLSMASWGTKTVRQAWNNLPVANRLDVARTLLNRPEAFDAFAKTAGMDLKGIPQSLGQQYSAASLLSSYLQGGATPAAIALQHVMNEWKRQNGDPNAPPAGSLGWQPGPTR